MVGKKLLCCLGAEIGTTVARRKMYLMLLLAFSQLEGSGVSSYFEKRIIHGFECGSELEDVEGFTLESYGGAGVSCFNLGFCTTSSTLGAGLGVLVICGGERFLFWLYGNIGGNGKFYKQG